MAQLAAVIDKLEDVAEPARQFYVAREGKFALDIGGTPVGFAPAADLASANSKVVEFRNTNIGLTKQVEELLPLKERYKDLDPDVARAAIAAQEELKKKGIKTPDDLAVLMKHTVDAAVKPLTEQITSITTTAQENQKRADAMTMRQTLGEKFVKAGGVAEATDFIVNKAQGVFKVVGGQVVAEATQFSADRPGELLSIDEWLTRQTKEAAFAFKASSGGGANPVIAGGGGPTRPPGQLVLKDPTPKQLGEHALEIRNGKMRVEYSDTTV